MKKDEILIKEILKSLNENPDREGLINTPARYLSFLKEVTTATPVSHTTFDAEGYDEMIVQKNIRFYSLCEHHLLPFFGTGVIAYIPNKRIVGLSKLARTLEFYSQRLQNQERITTQVADELEAVLKPKGVAVILSARHMCMEMRGVCQPEAVTTSSRLTGVFKSRPETRAELMKLAL